jgi:hypothetical protein
MPATRNHPSISAARADALFASELQQSEQPSAPQVRQAIVAAVRRFGDGGCAERVAHEFGEHPELAVARMRWAQQTVGRAYGGSKPRERGGRRASPPPAGRAA